MSTTQSDRLRGLLKPLVAAKGLDLEEIEMTRAGKRRMLRIIVDSDEGVELDACAELSREVSDKLDETDVMGEDEYVLEVSSPGADRPLTEHRHYVRAVGRLVKFQLSAEGEKGAGELVARILGVDDEGLDLEVPGVKGRKATARRIAFTDIAKARVEIEFNRKDKKEEEA
ncbi:ribosome maturation factor RimP [Streptomyces nojiriensis]|uniref:Ribosome maturation factor RimP n=1 Tax=Streptomyces nojiriensis TaxID=66374 RepID=A0ABQ3SEP4_9ACTN|nr:ribosome maturation factor RimP [Streptomyces nojiriensis]QTI48254.1 Ribosome maturation factor RimP [Streptomyces nojiriensis]GGS26428.1 ribosome maturation factor RimP [Streptomyces nojiriensis]GHI66606.1 ribosome maturation factor RimP [Streptomyces nojiriensis]